MPRLPCRRDPVRTISPAPKQEKAPTALSTFTESRDGRRRSVLILVKYTDLPESTELHRAIQCLRDMDCQEENPFTCRSLNPGCPVCTVPFRRLSLAGPPACLHAGMRVACWYSFLPERSSDSRQSPTASVIRSCAFSPLAQGPDGLFSPCNGRRISHFSAFWNPGTQTFKLKYQKGFYTEPGHI